MPAAAKRPCSQPGCAALVTSGRCDLHKRKIERGPDNRGSSTRRGYGADWQKLRAWFICERGFEQVVAGHPPAPSSGSDLGAWCEQCLKVQRYNEGTDVDHIKPKRLGGLDEECNLQVLCHKCHSRKTARGR